MKVGEEVSTVLLLVSAKQGSLLVSFDTYFVWHDQGSNLLLTTLEADPVAISYRV